MPNLIPCRSPQEHGSQHHIAGSQAAIDCQSGRTVRSKTAAAPLPPSVVKSLNAGGNGGRPYEQTLTVDSADSEFGGDRATGHQINLLDPATGTYQATQVVVAIPANRDFDSELRDMAEAHGVTMERTDQVHLDRRGLNGTNEAFVTFTGSEDGMRSALGEVSEPYDALS